MWRNLLLLVVVHLGSVYGATGPIFVIQPEDTLHDTSSNLNTVSLECRATGDEPITYRWMFGGNELSSATNNRLVLAGGRLTINNPDKDTDRGEYVCEASNEVGTIRSLPAMLSFAYVNPFDPSRGSDVVLTIGEGSCLDCNPPEHYPDILVTWTRITDEGIFPISSASQRIRVMSDGRLCFAYVVQGDTGSYMCHVRSDIDSDYSTGEQISPMITVTTTEIPNPRTSTRIELVNSPQDVMAVQNSMATFECFAFGRIGSGSSFSPPVITWTRTEPPGSGMPTSGTTSDGGEEYVIRSVQTGDAGTYRCSSGSVQASATLSVVEPPTWVTEPISRQQDINTDVTWTVEATGDQLAYTWYRNGMAISSMRSEVPSIDDRHTFSDGYRTLSITDLTVDDTAMYQCFASNDYGMLYSAAQLTVRAFEPQFIESMAEDQPAPLGATITIECPVDGAPYPTITWYHGGAEITESNHYDLTSDPPNLVIVDVQSTDSGVYRCSADNRFGASSDEGSIVIKDATMITVSPENTLVQVGNSEILQCRASHDASLELSYIWQHNGVQIDLSERNRYRMPYRNKGDLEIVEATMQDGGNYTCVALTVADSASRTAQVDIAGPPGPPVLQRVTITDRTANLVWSPGSLNNSPIRSFTVEGKTNYDEEWVELRNGVAPGLNSVRVISLDAYSRYTFRVFATNDIGAGAPSEALEASEMTAKAPPETYPENVGGGGGNTGDLRITWDRFPPSEWNSDTVSYNVEWRLLQSQVSSTGTTDQTDATVFVATENIDLYVQYEVRVQATNDISSGPWSPWVVIYSYQEAPKSPPTSIIANGMSSSTIEVSWTGVDPGEFRGELEGYKLKFWPEGDDMSTAQMAMSTGTRTRTTIPGLEANTAYSIVVTAYSGGGDGPQSAQVSTRTRKLAPRQKPELVRADVTGTDIRVTWNPIVTTNSEEQLQGYKVRYRKSGVFEEDAETISTQGSGTEATIRGLNTDTTYLITVQGYSNGGLGAMSDPPVSITTGEVKTGSSGSGGNGASSTVQSISLALLFLVAFVHTITHL